MTTERERVIIIGAAGRDFHNFNCWHRTHPEFEVIGFTANQAQIPIDTRIYPAVLAGPLYPNGIPIFPEVDLEKIIKEHKIGTCILAYSDLPHLKVMELATRCLSAGSDFSLMSGTKTMCKSTKPVIAVTAVRTGCGKSQTSRYICQLLKKHGLVPAAIRHPMPYGDLAKQAVQRFGSYEDLAKHEVTIEEREEYELHIREGTTVWAGVDFEAILREAEKESDVILWDGGNNDLSFYKPDYMIVVVDPLRPGHELTYYPGAVNFCTADAIVINKANAADPKDIEIIKANAAKYNPKADVIICDSEIICDKPELIKDKTVLLIDDGPTLTHGEMPFGAGKFAANKYGAKDIADPRDYLVGSLINTFKIYKHLEKVLPAMGYTPVQIEEMEKVVEKVPCDTVLIATPMDLRKLVKIDKPCAVVGYVLGDKSKPYLSEYVEKNFISKIKK